MKKTKLTRSLMAAVSVVALSAVMYGCVHSGDDSAPVEPPAPTAVDLSGVTAGYMAAAGTYEIGAGQAMTVGDVTFSCAAGGADCTVMVADDGTATYATDGGMVTAMNSAAYQARLTMDEQRTSATNAVSAAEMAVAALTNMSSDDDVMAAQGLIDAASTAVSATTVLPASEVLALQGRISAAQTAHDMAETSISNYRTHKSQLGTANDAVDAARMAVAGLNAMSSDADVTAAETAIADAKAAVTAGTMLTASDLTSLNGAISTIETSLGTKKSQIADFRTHGNQYTAAMNAVNAATDAVAGLTAMSTDGDVTAAEMAIEAAEAAVAAGTSLTADEVAKLNGMIAIAKVNLGTAKTTIADYRTRLGQMTAADNAVEAAEMAVNALDINSSDAAVTDAKNKIAAAKQAVTDGTMLTQSEKDDLNGKITAAETTLGGVEDQIAIRKSGEIAQQIVGLHSTADEATRVANAAGDRADQAVLDADKYSMMLDVASVKGDSSVAKANAEKVLEARTTVTEAVKAAEAAKGRAETAKTEAEAIADGTDGKTEVIAALNEAIKVAEAQIAATKAIDTAKNADESVNADGVKLRTAVQAVEGSDEDDKTTPTDIAEGVAMAIGGALLPTAGVNAATPDGTARRVEHYATPDTLNAVTDLPAVADRTFHDNNSRGMTWAQIVGAANVVMERVGASNAVRSLAPISGTAADIDADLTATGGTNSDGMYDDGFTSDSSTYMGIPGDVFCLGGTAGCSVDADGNLMGGWYFSPDDDDAVFIAATAPATGYVADTGFIQWGHWLTVDDSGGATDGEVTIHTYATSGANTANLNIGVSTATGQDETATYDGSAAGMSVHKEFDSNGAQTSIYSGAFTADVELTARFGTAPMIKGTVDNFQSKSGMNTDSAWSVALQDTALDTTNANHTTGVAKGSGQAGDWSAQGYGPEQTTVDGQAVNHRPTGFFGNFEAHFTDGHASGAYYADDD